MHEVALITLNLSRLPLFSNRQNMICDNQLIIKLINCYSSTITLYNIQV